jgi:hypothetical protein
MDKAKTAKTINWLAANLRIMRRSGRRWTDAHLSQVISRSSVAEQIKEKEKNFTDDIINFKNEMNTKMDTKIDNAVWKEANDDLDFAINTLKDMVLRLEDRRRSKFITIKHNLTAVEIDLDEFKEKITSDTDKAVNALKDLAAVKEDLRDNQKAMLTCFSELAEVRCISERDVADAEARLKSDIAQAVKTLNGRIDFTNKDLAATQESLHVTQNSLSDCVNEMAVLRSDLERNVADIKGAIWVLSFYILKLVPGAFDQMTIWIMEDEQADQFPPRFSPSAEPMVPCEPLHSINCWYSEDPTV